MRDCCLLLLVCTTMGEKPRPKDESILEAHVGHAHQEGSLTSLMRSEEPASMRLMADGRAREYVSTASVSHSVDHEDLQPRERRRRVPVGESESLLETDSKGQTDSMTFRSWASLWHDRIKDGILTMTNMTNAEAKAKAKSGNWEGWQTGQCAGKTNRPVWRTRKDEGTPGDATGCQSICMYREQVTACEYDSLTGVCYSFTENVMGVAGSNGQCCLKLPSDCEFSEWKEDGECTTTCGPGKVDRKRKVLIPAHMGGACNGDRRDEHDCEIESCPPVVPVAVAVEAGARHGVQLGRCVLASTIGLSLFSAFF